SICNMEADDSSSPHFPLTAKKADPSIRYIFWLSALFIYRIFLLRQILATYHTKQKGLLHQSRFKNHE
ncbi:hypothetical protein, partial [Peribacillus butanolivorans]|uniref:hypothetical protein n=1 Tax=Peribacillus butanolivorans TaxID=421767 RepID=UPI0035D5AF6E